MQNGWSFIRDSNDFINKIKNVKNIPSNSILVTADVVDLYPSIPHESGLSAIKEALENRARKSVPTNDILKMLEFVLKNNYFEFNGNVRQQLSGTAIGTKCALPYARIFMDKAETHFPESQKLKPMVWFRCIDDNFFVWTHGEQEVQCFLQELNKTHPNLKFMHESSKEKISFLDLFVSLCNGNLYTDLHTKATDCHQYLEYASSHPEHTKKSTIYSQTLCLSRLWSFEQEFEGDKRNLRSWFVKRSYPEEIIVKEMSKFKFNFSKKINPKEKEEKDVPLVVTYHPSLNCLSKIVRDNLYLLYMNDVLKKVFLRNLWYLSEVRGS